MSVLFFVEQLSPIKMKIKLTGGQNWKQCPWKFPEWNCMWFGRNTDEKEYIKNLKYRKYNTKKKKDGLHETRYILIHPIACYHSQLSSFSYTLIITESNLIFVHLHIQVWKRTCSQDSMQLCEELSAPHASVAYGNTFSSSNMTHKSSIFINLSHHCGGYWPTFLYSVALVRWHLQGHLCAVIVLLLDLVTAKYSRVKYEAICLTAKA